MATKRVRFERYCKLGTAPYGILKLDFLPKVGDRFEILENPREKWSSKVPVLVESINYNCIFLSRF